MQTFEEMIPQNSYQKQPPFYKLDELYKTNTTTSFLYLNSKYFSNGETFLSRAPRRIEHDFIPDDDGCMAYQYSLGNIHPFTMNKFQEVYSLEGNYADIYKKGYLISYDYATMLKYCCSENVQDFVTSYYILDHDKYLLFLIKSRLVAESLLSNADGEYFGQEIMKLFNHFCTQPLASFSPKVIPEMMDKEYLINVAKNSSLPQVYHNLLTQIRTEYNNALTEGKSPDLPKKTIVTTKLEHCEEITRS